MSINEQPLVTVYIPTFNRLELLKRAVKSVQNQTYQNLEVIIVDDCSTDGTQDYLVQLAKEDSRICYFLKEKNSGACVSRNIAIENATGEFITGLDDDDYFKPHRIYDFMEKIIKYGSSVIFFTNYIVKNNKEEKTTKCKLKEVDFKNLLINNYIGNQIFTKTENLKKSGGFDESLEIWQDLEFWIRLSKYHKFIYLENSSYVIDISGEIVRITNSKVNKIMNSYFKIIDKNHFSYNDQFLIKHHVLYYNVKLISFYDLFYIMKIRPSYFVFKSLVKRLFF